MISRLHKNAGIDYEPEQDALHPPAHTGSHIHTHSQVTHAETHTLSEAHSHRHTCTIRINLLESTVDYPSPLQDLTVLQRMGL